MQSANTSFPATPFPATSLDAQYTNGALDISPSDSFAWLDATMPMLLDESLWNEPGWNQHVEHFPQPLAVDNLYAFYDTFEPPGVSPDTTLPVLTSNQSSPTNDSSASSTTQETNPNRKRLGEDSRKTLLAQDDYILSFTPKQVICSGCRKIIKLDGREHARYYTTFWYNHKARCLGVDVGITAAIRREMDAGTETG